MDLSNKIKQEQLEASKKMANSLMESWDSYKFRSKNSGSYEDSNDSNDSDFSEVNETEDDSKFYEMTREELVNFILDGEDEAMDIFDKYSDEDLVEIAIEKSKVKGKEPVLAESSNKNSGKLDLGIIRSIDKIKSFSISEQASFKIMLEKYKNAILTKNIPESILIESYINDLKSFDWEERIRKDISFLTESLAINRPKILVENALYQIRRDAGWKFYEEATSKMKNWLFEEETASPKFLAKSISKWSFNPIIKNLVNSLNEMESTSKSLNIPSKQGESFVERLYSPVEILEGNTTFIIGDSIFKASESGIKRIHSEELSESYARLVKAFKNPRVRINENGISFYIGKEIIKMQENGDIVDIKLNDKKIEFKNSGSLAKVLESNFNNTLSNHNSSLVSDIIHLYENFDSIVELDFAKSIKSRIYESLSVNLIKWNNKIFLNRVNQGMNENSLYEANGVKAVRFVKETLNYDISEGLSEFLEGELKVKSIMKNDLKSVMDNISILENELAKIARSFEKDRRIAESPQVVAAKKMLESELEVLREKWNAINNELESLDNLDFDSLEDVNEDSKFSIGDQVKIKESGDTGKVISIDGTSGTYTVLHDSGKTGDYGIDEIVDLEESIKKAETENSEETETVDSDNDQDSAEEKE